LLHNGLSNKSILKRASKDLKRSSSILYSWKVPKHSNPEFVNEHRRSLLEESERGSSGNMMGKQSHPGIHLLCFLFSLFKPFLQHNLLLCLLLFSPYYIDFSRGRITEKLEF